MNRIALLFVCAWVCLAQSAPPDDYRHHDLTVGFRYEVKLGQNSYSIGNAPGYAIRYSYRPVRWLALEAGLEQIPRPIGGSICCEFLDNANDELYLVPFGGRFLWEPRHSRIRLSAGGGGAWFHHAIPHDFPPGGLVSASAWGGQATTNADYGLTHSGRIRLGVTAHYYYIPVSLFRTARIFTIGPDFTFSFR